MDYLLQISQPAAFMHSHMSGISSVEDETFRTLNEAVYICIARALAMFNFFFLMFHRLSVYAS